MNFSLTSSYDEIDQILRFSNFQEIDGKWYYAPDEDSLAYYVEECLEKQSREKIFLFSFEELKMMGEEYFEAIETIKDDIMLGFGLEKADEYYVDLDFYEKLYDLYQLKIGSSRTFRNSVKKYCLENEVETTLFF